MHDSRRIWSIIVILFLGMALISRPLVHQDARTLFSIILKHAAIIGLAFLIARSNIWLAAFYLLCFYSSMRPFLTVQSAKAFEGVTYAAILYVLIVNMVKGCHVRYLHDMLVAVCVIYAVGVFFGRKWVALNPNMESAFFAFCFMSFFVRPKYKYLLPFPIFGLVYSQSLGGAVAVFCGLLTVAALRKEWILACMLVLCGVASALVVDQSWNRWPVWVETWTKIVEAGWRGIGLGHWKVEFAFVHEITIKDGGVRWVQAHNEWLQCMCELGWLFPVIVAGYIVDTVMKYRRSMMLAVCGLVVLFANAVVNFPFHVGMTAILAVILLATKDLLANNKHVMI